MSGGGPGVVRPTFARVMHTIGPLLRIFLSGISLEEESRNEIGHQLRSQII